MRGDCVRHSVAFFVHGMLINTVEHVQRGVSHALLCVFWRDVESGHDGGGIMPEIVEATGKSELVPHAHISICNNGGVHAGNGLRRLVAEVADGRDDECIQTANDAVAAAGGSERAEFPEGMLDDATVAPVEVRHVVPACRFDPAVLDGIAAALRA